MFLYFYSASDLQGDTCCSMAGADQRELQQFVMEQRQKVETQTIIAGITDGAAPSRSFIVSRVPLNLRVSTLRFISQTQGGVPARAARTYLKLLWYWVAFVCCGGVA